MMSMTFRSTSVLLSVCFFNLFCMFYVFSCVFVCMMWFWCVLCVWAKLPEIKLDDDDDDDDGTLETKLLFCVRICSTCRP